MVRKRATPEFRRSQIIAAADLVLLEIGIEHFTVDQVIERAKIAKGTVYNYYKNKDEMLAELGYKALSLMHSLFYQAIMESEESINKLRAICTSSYDFYQLYPQYFELISYMERPDFKINTHDYVKISHNITDMVNRVVVDGQEKGEIRQSLAPEMITYIIWASCVGVVQFVESKKKLLKNHHEINTAQMVETFAEMITVGIKA
ncbi:MAG: TetR/AcrR family transcriptional regulator [Bacteroidota bacterium]